MKILFPVFTYLILGISFVWSQSFSTVHQWMFDNWLTTMAEENFRPNDYITRGEVAKNFSQLAVLLDLEVIKSVSECEFNDIDGYDNTLVSHIVKACQYGVVKWSNWNYLPNERISEAELITVAVRILRWVQDETQSPWWKVYYEMWESIGILDEMPVWDLDKPATRKTVGTWLYKAVNVDLIDEQEETPAKEINVSNEYKSALYKATSYANTMHMSKQGVFDQLVSEYGEQFTTDAAQYAIENVQADWKENALAKAITYANTMHMSKKSVYDQLVSEYGEEFTEEESQYAIDNVQANWNENALIKAESYQEKQNMSPAAIYDQLISEYGEKFTEEEAEYAIKNLTK